MGNLFDANACRKLTKENGAHQISAPCYDFIVAQFPLALSKLEQAFLNILAS
jgi:hypothetical protein